VLTSSGPEQVGKHGRFADTGLLGRGEQRQLPIARESAQVRQDFCARGIAQLEPVTPGELREAVWIVAIPLAQFV
jgi:hypothetical protein